MSSSESISAHLLHSERGFCLLGHVFASRWSSLFCFAVLVGLLTFYPPEVSGFSRLTYQLCMAAVLVSCVYRDDHVLRPVLPLRPIQRIGKISYGIYLFHMPLIVLAVRLTHVTFGTVWSYVLSLLITITVAELSFRFFESPLLHLKRRYSVVHQARLVDCNG